MDLLDPAAFQGQDFSTVFVTGSSEPAAFFDNGGRRAYVVRIVHRYVKRDGSDDSVGNAGGVASSAFAGMSAGGGRPVVLRARSEGSWGNGLRATLSFASRVLALGHYDQPSNTFTARQIAVLVVGS